jgi:hypothetical protein
MDLVVSELASHQPANRPTNCSPAPCPTCKRSDNPFVRSKGSPCPQCARPYYGPSCSVCLRPWPTIDPQTTARGRTAGQTQDLDVFPDLATVNGRQNPGSAPDLSGTLQYDRTGGCHHPVDNSRFHSPQGRRQANKEKKAHDFEDFSNITEHGLLQEQKYELQRARQAAIFHQADMSRFPPSASGHLEPKLTAASASAETPRTAPRSPGSAQFLKKGEIFSQEEPQSGADQSSAELSQYSIPLANKLVRIWEREEAEVAREAREAREAVAAALTARYEQLAAEEAAGFDPLPSQKTLSDRLPASSCEDGHPPRSSTSQQFTGYVEQLQQRRGTTELPNSPVQSPRPQPALRIPSPNGSATRWERFLRHRHVQRVRANLTMNRMDSYHAGMPLDGQSPRKHYRRWKKALKLSQRTC